MKNIFKLLSLFTISLGTLVGCKNAPISEVTITFDSNGGSFINNNETKTLKVNKGTKWNEIKESDKPKVTLEDKEFKWWTLENKQEAINDTYEFNEDTKLFAFYEAKEPTIKVESIKITHSPIKTDYNEGECLDLDGLVVIARLSDHTERVLDSKEYVTYPNTTTPLKEGQNTVIVSYSKDISTSFSIEVGPKIYVKKIEVTKFPKKLYYVAGEFLDLNGLEVTATYIDDTTRVLEPIEYKTNPDIYTPLKEDHNSVEVIYNNKVSTSFAINVNAPVVRSIKVNKLPKTEFYIGDGFNSNNLIVGAVLSDLSIRVLDRNEYSLSISEGEILKEGKHEVLIKYTNEITTSYEINVIPLEVKSIKITHLPTTDYYEGETLDLKNLEVTAILSGKEKPERVLDKSEYTTSISIDQPLTENDKKVIITYTATPSITTSFDISVTNPYNIKEIVITSPDKTNYVEGQKLDLNGFKVTIIHKDDTEEDITNDCYTIPSKTTKLNIFDKSVNIYYTDHLVYYKTIGSFNINVIENKIEKIEITQYPRTVYYTGQKLDLSNLIVTATMTDLSTKDVTHDELLSISLEEGTVLENDTTIEISYSGLEQKLTLNIIVQQSTEVWLGFYASPGHFVGSSLDYMIVDTKTGVFYKDLDNKPVAEYEDDTLQFIGWSLSSEHYVPVDDDFEFTKDIDLYAYFDDAKLVNLKKASFERVNEKMTIFVEYSNVINLPNGTKLTLNKYGEDDNVINITFDSNFVGIADINYDIKDSEIDNIIVINKIDKKGIEINLSSKAMFVITEDDLITQITFDIIGYTLPNESHVISYSQHISWDPVSEITFTGSCYQGTISNLIPGNYYIFKLKKVLDEKSGTINAFFIDDDNSKHLGFESNIRVYYNNILDPNWKAIPKSAGDDLNCIYYQNGPFELEYEDSLTIVVQIDESIYSEDFSSPFRYYLTYCD